MKLCGVMNETFFVEPVTITPLGHNAFHSSPDKGSNIETFTEFFNEFLNSKNWNIIS